MKVLQVVKGLRKSSGVGAYVRDLADALFAAEEQVAIGMLKPETQNWQPPEGGEPVVELCAALRESWDVVHVHGLWDREIRLAAEWAVRNGVPLVWSPHGMLAPWALKYHWWKKCVPWHFFLKRLLRRTAVFHVTSQQEADWVRALGFGNQIAVVPIGLEAPAVQIECVNGKALHQIVFIGRIHKVKAVDRLLKAWEIITKESNHHCQPQPPTSTSSQGWELVIAGPDGGARGDLGRYVLEHKIPRVRFVGELHGADKYRFLALSDVCVLPSFSENFGITVAEALVCRTPVVVSKGAPWSGIVEQHCGWWVENTPETLAMTLEKAMELSDEERRTMGASGRAWILRDFSWKSVGEKMKLAYQKALDLSAEPSLEV